MIPKEQSAPKKVFFSAVNLELFMAFCQNADYTVLKNLFVGIFCH
jgi:hypothetical protein